MQNLLVPMPEFVRVRLENEARRVGFPADHLASLLVQDGLIRRTDARRQTLWDAHRASGRPTHCLSCGKLLDADDHGESCYECDAGLTDDLDQMLEEGH